jgi:hypothetical protein
MELKNKDVMQKGDIMHWGDGSTEIVVDFAGTKRGELKEWNEISWQSGNPWSEVTKVTRGETMKEKKDYPSKFYAQRCMTNDDPTDLRINVNPKDLDMDYPVLEITYSKKGFKIRQVMLKVRETITAEEVK